MGLSNWVTSKVAISIDSYHSKSGTYNRGYRNTLELFIGTL